MKYIIDKDEFEDFELTVLEYIKESVPHTEENWYIVFDEDTYNKIESIENINDGTIREIIWNEENAQFFRDCRKSIIDYLQWIIKDTNLRPFAIMGEIQKSLNGKKIEGLGKLMGGDFSLNFLTEEISAYEQTFVLTSYD